eukprot:gene16135-22289_t
MADSDSRASHLRAEHERALVLLQKEKSAAAAIQQAAKEKFRRVDAAAETLADNEDRLRRRVELAEAQLKQREWELQQREAALKDVELQTEAGAENLVKLEQREWELQQRETALRDAELQTEAGAENLVKVDEDLRVREGLIMRKEAAVTKTQVEVAHAAEEAEKMRLQAKQELRAAKERALELDEQRTAFEAKSKAAMLELREREANLGTQEAAAQREQRQFADEMDWQRKQNALTQERLAMEMDSVDAQVSSKGRVESDLKRMDEAVEEAERRLHRIKSDCEEATESERAKSEVNDLRMAWGKQLEEQRLEWESQQEADVKSLQEQRTATQATRVRQDIELLVSRQEERCQEMESWIVPEVHEREADAEAMQIQLSADLELAQRASSVAAIEHGEVMKRERAVSNREADLEKEAVQREEEAKKKLQHGEVIKRERAVSIRKADLE